MSTATDNFPERARSALIKLCNDRLADAVDLQLQCKHAYWNTTAPDLTPLRELFDELNESVEDSIDRIAECAVELGGVANSTERIVATWSHVLCSPDAACRNQAQTIATALASFGELVRQTIDTANGFSDSVSAEMFTEISEGVYKWRRSLSAIEFIMITDAFQLSETKNSKEHDLYFLNLTLALAAKGEGQVRPNPLNVR